MSDAMVSVASLAQVNPRTERPKKPGIDVSFIPMSDVSNTGRWVHRQTRQLREVQAGYTAFSEDDVLFAKITPCMENGKGALVRGLKGGIGFGSTEFHVLRAIPGRCTPEFLSQIASFPALREKAVSFFTGSAGQRRVSEQFFEHYFVPDYSTEEQGRIADLLSAVDERIELIQAEVEKLEQLTPGAFDDAFSAAFDQALNRKVLRFGRLHPGWCRVPLLAAVSQILDFRGRTPIKLGMNWGGGDIPALSANNVEMGRVNFAKEFYVGSPALYEKWMTQGDCSRDDVLMTLEAPLGNVALVPDDQRYILSQRVVLLKPNPELVDGPYLALYLRWRWFQQLLVEESTGTTASGIQRKKLEKLPVLVPMKGMRIRITEVLTALLAQRALLADSIEKLKLQKLGLLQNLLTVRTQVS
jgi:type I restriction enzyme S subunit